MFVFVVGDRTEKGDFELVLGPEYTKADAPVTLYLFSSGQVSGWIERSGFELLRSLPFPMYMDPEKTESQQVKCYVVRKT